ncbi:MAG: tetratricopeptide repeat protein [Pyrinomonadaceae bacterium]|nr:tetratricopeptide repeat protein [Pyrinomonadaceae bacterium]
MAGTRCFALLLLISCSMIAAQTTDREAVKFQRLEQSVAMIREGRLPQAESLINSVLSGAPRDADALNLLGVVRAQQKRTIEAEQLFRRAIGVAATHFGAHLNLAELYLTTQRPQQALPVLLAAHRLAPDRPDINLNLATLYEGQREYELAWEHLRLIPREAANADYFLRSLTSLLGLKRLDEAHRLALEVKESGALDAEARARFAILLAEGGLSDAALNLLEAALNRTPESVPVLYALGIINGSAKRYEKADEYLSEVLRARPDDVAVLRAIAAVARATGNLEKSLANLMHARRVAPDSPQVLYDFGATALQMDLFLDALPVFEQLHQLFPREPAYLYALAAARLKKGERVEAERLAKIYVELRPRDFRGFYLLGAARHNLARYAEARSALERSLNLKSDPDTEYLLGLNFYKEGNRATSIEVLRRVISTLPDHAAARGALGVAYREQGDYKEARVMLERAVELDASDLRSHYQLGLVYAKLGEKESATKMFERADELRARQRNRESVILKLIDPP